MEVTNNTGREKVEGREGREGREESARETQQQLTTGSTNCHEEAFPNPCSFRTTMPVSGNAEPPTASWAFLRASTRTPSRGEAFATTADWERRTQRVRK
jgi:hypothetical protein